MTIQQQPQKKNPNDRLRMDGDQEQQEVDYYYYDDDNDVDAIEELAGQVVSLVSSFIDFLRSEFGTNPTAIATAAATAPLHLWSRLVELGLNDQLESILSIEREIFQRGVPSQSQNRHDSDDDDDDKNDERHQLVVNFAISVIRSFTSCYKVLDRLPNKEDSESTTEEEKKHQAVDLASRKVAEAQKKNKKKNKAQPPPPRGMLSLQNYTDIACLLEFVVCTGILPHLEDGVLWNIKDRVRFQLPKSLAGRIPRAALCWGMDTHAKTMTQATASPKNMVALDELISVIGSMTGILFLDRFRPMMLPRHLSDVYAALFQAEQLLIQSVENSGGHSPTIPSTIPSVYQSLGLKVPPIVEKAVATGQQPNASLKTLTFVDPTLQARTYQTLLLNGKKSPLWLRRRVSPLLTDLACRNLAVIIAVFVPQQGNQVVSNSQDDLSSSACQRLGQTLATSAGSAKVGNNNLTTVSSAMERQLCVQILQLLNWVYPQTTKGTLSSQVLSIIQTCWAMMDHLPSTTVESCILVPWRETLTRPQETISVKGNTIHRSIQQIGAIFSFIPPPQRAQSRVILDFMRCSTSNLGGTVWDQLARLVSTSKLEAVKSSTREDAGHLLRILTQTANEVYDSKRDGSSDDSLVVTWVDSLSPSSWDLNGFRFVWEDLETGSQSQISETVTIVRRDNVATATDTVTKPPANLSDYLDDTTARVTGCLDHVLKVIVPPNGSVAGSDGSKVQAKTSSNRRDNTLTNLPSRIFRWLLQNYLQGRSTNEEYNKSGVENRKASRRFVSMILLPKICEEFPHEQLLFGDGSDGLGLLLIIKNTISELVVMRRKKSTSEMIQSTEGFVRERDNVLNDDLIEASNKSHLLDSQQDDDILPVIASIVMSMLIAMLELGSKKRSDDEESLLQSILPFLLELSQFEDEVGVTTEEDTAVADMASYAMSLLAARQCTHDESRVNDQDDIARPGVESNQEKIRRLIDEARLDLKSLQPPIRAKGMVTLGRLARGFAGSLDPQQKSFVEELDGVTGAGDRSSIVNEILDVSMTALADEESYVYLAAIQTIVALGDLHSKYVLPVVASCVATGQLPTRTSSSTPETLSNELRIKLAESLMFIIRRRAVVDEFIPTIVSLMLYGTASIGAGKEELVGTEDQVEVLEATQTYFVGELDSDLVSSDENEKREYLSERDIRLKTGGPIFDIEEFDVVRSVRVSVLAELVLRSSPFSVAPHVQDLVHVIVNVLRLDHSRSVSRAAALLAVAVYSSVVEESEAVSDALSRNGRTSTDGVTIPFSLALVKADESMLLTCLQRYESTGLRLSDEATTARCQEALALRHRADEAGILLTAQLVAREEENASPIPSLLTSMLHSGKSTPSSSKIFELDPVEILEEGKGEIE